MGKVLFIGVCYRSPSAILEEEIKIWNGIRNYGDKTTLLMGDFNYPEINWDTLEAGIKRTVFSNNSGYFFVSTCNGTN